MSKKAFVIMSFDPKYDDVFDRSIKPAFESCGYECDRADKSLGTENIPHRVVKNIIDADIVLADLSGNSPNVFYELGVSHSVDNKTLVIISEDEIIPFDISTFRAMKYNRTPDGLQLLKFRLVEQIKGFKRENMINLVQEAGRDYFDLRRKIEYKLQQLNEEIKRAKKFSEAVEKDFPEKDNTAVIKKIVEHINEERKISPGKTIIVSICGSGAIGKSTFSGLLKEDLERNLRLKVDVLPTDCYMLSRADRIERDLSGFDPEANDLHKFYQDVKSLLEGNEIRVNPYNHKTGEHEEEITVKPSDVLILEGIFSFYPSIINLARSTSARQLRYFIYADKHRAKELKFISDIKERGHNIYRALQHSVPEYSAYETFILPHIKLADYIVRVVGYWEFSIPEEQDINEIYEN